ncbi:MULTISPECIES: MarR family transcriptional regulator, partial [Actinomycetes]|uniref:MarR family protein n=1 Tax=Streptoalloteichus tenebrarius (strain ATCC 17920 / DSM 40477 / JCM 4838 / CBS 697.72 / NBRC 16177 / NCIMB 11028 / NRRL B-12390 / A12253. 1 / ISP 5477) TaxID=1933 RepID=A0ABT1I199_STRSD
MTTNPTPGRRPPSCAATNRRRTPSDSPALRVVPTPEDKLWAALYAHPNSTATDLATQAGLGKSTAAKILARWATDATSTHDAPPTEQLATEPPQWLAPGALRGLVEGFLRDHPGEEFTPNTIAKALNRSSGAVHNALEKLVAAGYAVKTQD